MNCDFSSNNNILARFLWWPFWILLVYFYYNRLAFRVWVFWQPFWTVILDFGLQTANFRRPHWAFAVLNKKWNKSGFRPPLCTYRINWARSFKWIYICLSNRITFRVHSTHIDLSLCWFNGVSLSATHNDWIKIQGEIASYKNVPRIIILKFRCKINIFGHSPNIIKPLVSRVRT